MAQNATLTPEKLKYQQDHLIVGLILSPAKRHMELIATLVVKHA